MRVNNSNYEAISLNMLIDKLTKEYESLYYIEIENDLYIYRPINRKEYKDILHANVSDLEKQDLICTTCILYPENFDIDNCDGGVPSQLYSDIVDKSCVSTKDMMALIEINREEMTLLDSQMTCIITEAFPSYKLEEVENMNMIQFTKLFARAEWILKTFRDCELNEDVLDILASNTQTDSTKAVEEKETKEEEVKNIPEKDSNQQDNNRKKMTPEQIKEYQEFCKKFPEFNMATDYGFTGDVGIGFDNRSPALRPGWGIPKNE